MLGVARFSIFVLLILLCLPIGLYAQHEPDFAGAAEARRDREERQERRSRLEKERNQVKQEFQQVVQKLNATNSQIMRDVERVEELLGAQLPSSHTRWLQKPPTTHGLISLAQTELESLSVSVNQLEGTLNAKKNEQEFLQHLVDLFPDVQDPDELLDFIFEDSLSFLVQVRSFLIQQNLAVKSEISWLKDAVSQEKQLEEPDQKRIFRLEMRIKRLEDILQLPEQISEVCSNSPSSNEMASISPSEGTMQVLAAEQMGSVASQVLELVHQHRSNLEIAQTQLAQLLGAWVQVKQFVEARLDRISGEMVYLQAKYNELKPKYDEVNIKLSSLQEESKKLLDKIDQGQRDSSNLSSKFDEVWNRFFKLNRDVKSAGGKAISPYDK